MAQEHRKAELIAELAEARARLSINTQALRRDLDLGTKARQAFKSSPLPWLGGAAVLGLIFSRAAFGRSRNKPVVVRKSAQPVLEKTGKAALLLGLLKMALDLARPAITAWAKQRVTDYVATRYERTAPPR